jgi:aminoglycoside 2''-phosphotransferase
MIITPGDLDRIGVRLLSAFPALDVITPLQVLGSGFNSTAIETAEGFVFRIGKNSLAAQGYVREAHLLPRLSAYLPLPVPNPLWHVPVSTAFPYGVIGYRKLPGRPLSAQRGTQAIWPQLGTALGRFLKVLHSFPIEEASNLACNQAENYVALHDEILPPLRQALTASQFKIIMRWWEAFLSDALIKVYQPVLCHGDFWYENILVDERVQTVTGIIDFEHMAVGDAAIDFAPLLYHGESFVAQVIHTYKEEGGWPGTNFVHRLQRLWELRDFAGIQYSIRFNDANELADSLEKIRQGPILNPHKRLRLIGGSMCCVS